MKSFIEMIRKITPRGWITGIVFFAEGGSCMIESAVRYDIDV